MDTTRPPHPLLDTDTAATAAGVTPRTIRRWVTTGILRNYGDPHHIRVRLDDVATARARRAIHRSGILDIMSGTV